MGGVLWEKKTVPGPTKLIGGNLQAGFYGEVPAKDLITGIELAKFLGISDYGLSTLTPNYSDEPWLKFSYLGKIEFIAKKNFYIETWKKLNEANAVFGNRTIDINGFKYKIRLMKGKNEGEQQYITDYKGSILHNSEWNRLMLPIHVNAPSNWSYPENVKSPTEKWGKGYTNEDLGINPYYGCWCQDNAEEYGLKMHRGNKSAISFSWSDYPEQHENWKPVLELVD